jgi:hypothetical protein
MRKIAILTAMIVSACVGSPVVGDLGTIERKIAKEPAYRSKEPRYCLLVFGPKAETRLWLVLDLPHDPLKEKPGAGDSLYADRNGDGDLTDPKERIRATPVTKKSSALGLPTNIGRLELEDRDITVPRFDVGDVKSRDGKKVYGNLTVDVGWYIFGRKDRAVTVSVDVPGRGRQSVGGQQLWFAASPDKAPVLWFDGALTLRLAPSGILHMPVDYSGKEPPPPYYEEFPLVRGKTMPLRVVIGSAGIGTGTFNVITADRPPADIHPIARVVFKHSDPKRPPLEVSVELNKRCCGTLFQGSVAVPAEAALGKATLTLSFPGWREGAVKPAVTEIAVSDSDTRPSILKDR